MAKYRAKPITVEAWQWNGKTHSDARKFCREKGIAFIGIGGNGKKRGLVIETPEMIYIAAPGDFVIKGPAGEFYTCRPDIFRNTYEKEGK